MLVGVNAYWLAAEAARGMAGDREKLEQVEGTLRRFAACGVRLVRTWAFCDDAEWAAAGDAAVMQRGPGMPCESGLRGLDFVVARARAHGLGLLLPFGNQWKEYGGARQYLRWMGHADAAEVDPRFYTDRRVVRAFTGWIAALLSRVNRETGVAYRDEPAVWAWELLNEPRGDGLDGRGRVFRAWIDEVGEAVRAAGARQPLATGEEGFDVAARRAERRWFEARGGGWMYQAARGASFRLDIESPWIDLASVHFYPGAWLATLDVAERVEALSRFLEPRLAAARAAGKPLYLGEVGVGVAGVDGGTLRRAALGWAGASAPASPPAAAGSGEPIAVLPWLGRGEEGDPALLEDLAAVSGTRTRRGTA